MIAECHSFPNVYDMLWRKLTVWPENRSCKSKTYFKKALPLPAQNKEGGAGKKKSTSPFASALVGKSPADSKIS